MPGCNHYKPNCMKSILAMAMCLFLIVSAQAQSSVYETTIKFAKKEKRALTYEVPFEPNVVEKTIEDMMAKRGAKVEKSRGFMVFKNVQVDDSSSERGDLYFKVDRKNRKDKNSTVTAFAVAPNANAAETDDNNELLSDTRALLTSMSPGLESTDHQFSLLRQEEKIRDLEKKMRKLEDDYADYEKKVRNLQEKMESNKRERETLRSNIETDKNALEIMRAKGTTSN